MRRACVQMRPRRTPNRFAATAWRAHRTLPPGEGLCPCAYRRVLSECSAEAEAGWMWPIMTIRADASMNECFSSSVSFDERNGMCDAPCARRPKHAQRDRVLETCREPLRYISISISVNVCVCACERACVCIHTYIYIYMYIYIYNISCIRCYFSDSAGFRNVRSTCETARMHSFSASKLLLISAPSCPGPQAR